MNKKYHHDSLQINLKKVLHQREKIIDKANNRPIKKNGSSSKQMPQYDVNFSPAFVEIIKKTEEIYTAIQTWQHNDKFTLLPLGIYRSYFTLYAKTNNKIAIVIYASSVPANDVYAIYLSDKIDGDCITVEGTDYTAKSHYFNSILEVKIELLKLYIVLSSSFKENKYKLKPFVNKN